MIGLARFGQFTFDETLGCVHILAGRQLKDSDGGKKEECLKEVHVGKGVMHVKNDNCAALKRMHIGVMASRKFSERIRVGCGLAERQEASRSSREEESGLSHRHVWLPLKLSCIRF